jgi:hypothetical protein
VSSDGTCVQPSDNCGEYGYIDQNGNDSYKNCSGSIKVCKTCSIGYYLNNNYKCKQIPKNCAHVNINTGKCIKCLSGCMSNGNDCVNNS